MPTNRCRIIFAALLCLSVAGCDKMPEQPSERETEATSLLQSSFRVTQEYWFGAETPLGRGEPRLVELRKAHPTILGRTVNDTDRLNGISDRFTLTVNCEQMRYWQPKDGAWSKWQQGTGGGSGEIIGALLGGGLSYWVVRFEKENGEWHFKPANGRNFGVDPAAIDRLMRDAGQ